MIRAASNCRPRRQAPLRPRTHITVAVVTGTTTPEPEDADRVETPAIGPPTRDTERRRSPSVLAASTRTRDSRRAQERLVTVVIAAGLSGDNLANELQDDPGIEVLASASEVVEAQSSIVRLMPRVALIGFDITPDPASIAELCATITELAPSIAIVAVAADDRAELYDCIRAGAGSCFYGRGSPMTLRRTVVAAHRRESVLSPGAAQQLLDDYQRLIADEDAVLAPVPALTSTEEEVLRRIAGGEAPDAIAAAHEVPTRMIGSHAGYAVAKLHRTYHDDGQFRLLR